MEIRRPHPQAEVAQLGEKIVNYRASEVEDEEAPFEPFRRENHTHDGTIKSNLSVKVYTREFIGPQQ